MWAFVTVGAAGATVDRAGLLPLEPAHHHHSKHHSHKGSGEPKKASFEDTRPDATGNPPYPSINSANSTSSSETWTCGANGCWPLMYMIGVQKSATTSLFKAIQSAGIVCGATWFDVHDNFYKEAHYFDRDMYFDENNEAAAAVTYTKLYKTDDKHCKGNSFMDATPAYASNMDVPARMKSTIPSLVRSQAKLIIILREPIARDLSQYNMLKGTWVALTTKTNNLNVGNVQKLFCQDATESFPSYREGVACMLKLHHDVCSQASTGPGDAYSRCGASREHIAAGVHNRLADGFYSAQIAEYEAAFSRNQLLVVGFENLIADQTTYLESIAAFLGVTNARRLHKMPSDNTAGAFPGKVTKIDCATRDALKKIYDPWNAKLYSALEASRAAGLAPPDEQELGTFPDVECNTDDSETFTLAA